MGPVRVLLLVLLGCLPAIRAADADAEFFETRIRPLLADHCHRCHGPSANPAKGGLRLASRDGLLTGGDTGPAVVPGNPERSLLIRAVAYEDADLQMPPKTRLSAEAIDDLRRWVRDGAVWPDPSLTAHRAALPGFAVEARRREHWAWAPIRRPPVPATRGADGSTTELDRFILAKLDAAGLRAAPTAGKRALIRRASFALTGLPPTPAEVEAFVAEDAPDAFARVVDRLLASPHYGERWARHWLDKVRYAETMGHEFDYPILGAWRYRDYVVRAFNGDVPYDRFVREQIAGDLLPDPRRHPADGANESLLATLQFWLCQQVHSPVDVRAQQVAVLDNQIDVVTKAFLGMTVACARCHDHKFDAISTRDFYALYGILGSSRYAIRAVDDPAPRQRAAASLLGWREAWRARLADRLERRLADGPSESGGERLAGGIQLRPEDRALPSEGWFADGEAFSADPAPGGQPVPGDQGEVRLVPAGWRHSASLARRFQGALRSPTFTLDRDYLHLRLAGDGARFGLVIEGFTLIRAPIYGALRQGVNSRTPHWVTLDVSMWRDRRAWLEYVDLAAPDPAAELPKGTGSPEGWIAAGEVVQSSLRTPPSLAPVDPPADPRKLVAGWKANPGALAPGETAWIESLLAACGPSPADGSGPDRAALEAAITPPILAGVMADGTGLDETVFIRGNHRTLGAPVPRRFLEAVAAGPPETAFRQGSGRLALAEAMTHADNPLVARVMVNWVWAHLFGRGLVASVDNFGVLGESPSHPELLDWLADEYRSSGWSTKALIRRIVLSRTWQTSSRAGDAEAERQDPNNGLWHRANLRRLEGEAIRDAMLAVSGRLDPAVGGPPVPVHLTEFMEGRGRPGESGPLDGAGRRSLYLEVRRNFLPPFMLAFDTPVPASTVGRRTVSNVPAQSLALMNDPFVAAQAQAWAERVRGETDGSPDCRVERMFLEAFARPPTGGELAAAREFLAAAPGAKGAEGTATGDGEAWVALGHALFNAKEFVFVE